MQFHLSGFKPGNPEVFAADDASQSETLPAKVDVLIVGCGPAGLTLAAQLAAFPDITTRIVEQKPGPIQLGQADGIACRTMEMFEAFGFAGRVEREAYWVNETTFWKPDEAQRDRLVRAGRVQDVEDGLSEFPHVILNQARVHDYFLESMLNSASGLRPLYSRRFADLTLAVDGPVTVRLERVDPGHQGVFETVSARYVVGCDGARSAVRAALGRRLEGDSSNQAWGVMDVLAVTDFPDIRLKTAIHSASEGSLLIIPREGGYLVRMYIELDKLKSDARLSSLNITADKLIAAAQRILRPYTLEVKEVAWWSCYEIGQRLTDKFDDVRDGDASAPRVFIAGDACHTHSPKAGQGMNVSMQDAFNLGWKLAAVLRGQASVDLLHSYSAERHAIAQELIEFDRAWAKMFSAAPKDPNDPNSEGVDPREFQRYFVEQLRFTAGTATRYHPSVLTGGPQHQALAIGFPVGMRFHSAPVIRLADAKPVHLGHAGQADGRWRLYLFAAADPASLDPLCAFLARSDRSPVRKYTAEGADIDAVFDVRAVFQQSHRDLPIETAPDFLTPRKGRLGLRDYEKMFCPDLRDGRDIFDLRGVDRNRGCVIVVRPDQYVSHVLPIEGHDELAGFFDRFMTG